jgi:hypothetical protein
MSSVGAGHPLALSAGSDKAHCTDKCIALCLIFCNKAQGRPFAPPTFGWRGAAVAPWLGLCLRLRFACAAGVPAALVWHWLRWIEQMALSAPSASAIFPGARTSPTLEQVSIDSTQPLMQSGQR